MDKRKHRTQKLIKEAFSSLIIEKRYSAITVQDILDAAEIGRATFYAHFKSKEEVLDSICADIFEHVTSSYLSAERYHDFSNHSDFSHHVTHMLCHFKEDKDVLKGILASEGHDVFLQDMKRHLFVFIEDGLRLYPETDVPEGLLKNHLVTSLIETVLWWIAENDCTLSAEVMTKHYFSLVLR
ncbi:MAG: TetR/AcrR family transcriptional regulator [Clostridia bacterium]|nr:TetR/AcrR family transcriptional regulator [Clostridia bacterium]